TPDGIMSTFATGFPLNFFLTGLAIDSAGNVFAAALNENDPNEASTLYKITLGGTVSTFGSIPGRAVGLAFDSAGNLFASDGVFLNIYKFTPEGSQSVFVGPSAFTTSSAPGGLAFDRYGNLFVSTGLNSPNDSILEFS